MYDKEEVAAILAKKRKMIQSNLVRNSIAAYFAAIEIHNKPNIPYRYETVTLLLMNAWELLLKAFVRKYIKSKSVFENKGHTISFSTALIYVHDYISANSPKGFTAVKENLFVIEDYRNNTVHFYNEALEPHIFMLAARAALNYVEFIKEHFNKDIILDEGLFIMPLGFKLPFKPEDFLSKKAVETNASSESRAFIQKVISVIENLKDQGIEDSIVLGFDLYLESVKKASNSDLLVAITAKDEADAVFTKQTSIRFTNEKGAPVYNMTDEQFREQFPYTYKKLVDWGRENIIDFKQGTLFNKLMKEIKKDAVCSSERRLDSKNPNTVSQTFYSKYGLQVLKEKYESE